MTPAYSIRNLTVAYDSNVVLENASVDFPAGKLTAIVGPNGAGKSTLIKAALGLIPRVTGHIQSHVQDVGYVPQRESVDWDFPVSALDVALMGTYKRVGWCRRPGKREVQEAERALDQVDMLPYKKRQISQLSGGQQQRVFLARALAQHAEMYFMDEPLAGVDAATEKAIISVLHDLRNQGKTVVAVHHDLESVTEYFDNVVLLNRSVVAAGPLADTFTTERLRETYGARLQFQPA